MPPLQCQLSHLVPLPLLENTPPAPICHSRYMTSCALLKRPQATFSGAQLMVVPLQCMTYSCNKCSRLRDDRLEGCYFEDSSTSNATGNRESRHDT